MMTCGCWTPHQSNADAAAKPNNAPTRPDGPKCGYSASHSRYFWGLRLHLVATPSGLPITWALAGAKTDERSTALEMINHARLARQGQTIIADKGYRSAAFEEDLNQAGMTLIRPATKKEQPRSGTRFLKPLRQIIESVNNTFKTQLDLERHGGRTRPGVVARILQRLLALTAVIWHNETTNQPGPARSLTAWPGERGAVEGVDSRKIL